MGYIRQARDFALAADLWIFIDGSVDGSHYGGRLSYSKGPLALVLASPPALMASTPVLRLS